VPSIRNCDRGVLKRTGRNPALFFPVSGHLAGSDHQIRGAEITRRLIMPREYDLDAIGPAPFLSPSEYFLPGRPVAQPALRLSALQQLRTTRGLPNAAQVVQDHSICGLDCGLKKQKPRPLPCLSSGRAETARRRPENFLGTLSNSGPAVRLYSEGRATGPPEDRYRRLS
jgi:hypothetical protein